MAQQLEFDKAARDMEVLYTSPIIVERRRRVLAALDPRPGEKVLDVGTGPGFTASDLAARVALGGSVTAIDRSREMLTLARRRCAEFPQVSFDEADATSIPANPAVFDAALAVQVYEFVTGVEAALRELRRVLRPGGRAVIVDSDWESLVWEAGDRKRAARIFHAWDEHLADPYLPRRLAPLARQVGFEVMGAEAYTAITLEHEAYVRGLAKMIADFVPGRGGVTKEDAVAWLDDLATRHARGEYFFSLSAYLFALRLPS